VLRLWPDKYYAALCPDRMVAVRRKRGLRVAAEARAAETFIPVPGGPAWAAAVEALKRFLAMPELGPGGCLGVVLSNHFVRYLLVPWSERIVSVDELHSYAAAAFEEVYGEISREWEVRVSPERSGSPRLAAAVDRALLDGIRQAVGASPLGLDSVQPYLMSAYNRAARSRHDNEFIFTVLEPDRVCILAAEGGRWRHVSATTAPDDPAALAALLEREICLADLKDGAAPHIFLHASHLPGSALPPVLGKTPVVPDFKSPAGLSPIANTAFALVATMV
jgi:hypothetical protein